MNDKEMDIHELQRITASRIAEWPKWKRDYHEYKKRIRHNRNGREYLLPKKEQR